jgi:hypothetical protein
MKYDFNFSPTEIANLKTMGQFVAQNEIGFPAETVAEVSEKYYAAEEQILKFIMDAMRPHHEDWEEFELKYHAEYEMYEAFMPYCYLP